MTKVKTWMRRFLKDLPEEPSDSVKNHLRLFFTQIQEDALRTAVKIAASKIDADWPGDDLSALARQISYEIEEEIDDL